MHITGADKSQGSYPSGGHRGMQGVNFLGLFDAEDRLMAVATHNTDIADGWEREGE